ncbi:MAG TPA: restriction endonuclease subunit S, partial [Acidobacteriaceae bacterium]|nr:restriction endonuclease subunit S [Acidobacteriaceae bacterium]
RFLYHQLVSKMDMLLSMVSRGATVHRLMTEQIRSLDFVLPPLAEQQRIVDILDEAFENIATAKAHAEKNLRNACALFESHLQSVFTQRGRGWVANKLKSVTTKIGSGATPRGGEESYQVEGISLIRSLNVHDFGFKYLKLAFLDDIQADELSNVRVQARDVLLNITGASVARCCIVPEDVLPARVNQHVSIIRPIAEKLDPDFLHYLLISKPYKDHLLQTGEEGGSTRQAITKAQIQDFSVEYPATVKEQKAIAAKLDAMLAETQHLESIYQQKLAALDALKNSLLHQAFSDQLSQLISKTVAIPFPVTLPNISSTDLHVGILAIAYEAHQKAHKASTFGHVKAEKIAHMVEAYVGVDLGRNPVRDAAGPNDFPHLKRVEHRADKAGYLTFKRQAAEGYKVTKKRGFDSLINKTRVALGDRNQKLGSLLDLMIPMDSKQAEIFATVYAAWNNLLIDKEPITDERIVQAAREDWHRDKLNIPRERFFRAIEWIRAKELCPEGQGKRVESKTK